jgi:SurA N-terminal domain
MLRRVVTAGALALVGVLGLSACTTHAGAAAQVGSQKIDTSTLRGMVDRGMSAAAAAPPSTDTTPIGRSDLQTRTLGELVYLDLLRDEASSLGVSASAADLSSYLQNFGILQFGAMPAFYDAAAQSGISRQDLALFAERRVLETKVGEKLVPNAVASTGDARAFYDQQVAKFNGLPLTFGAVQDFLVHVIVADTEVTPVVLTKLRGIAGHQHISINPRFGQWDNSQFNVVTADGSIATKPAPAPSAAGSSLGVS